MKTDFGTQVRTVRTLQGLSQTQLADLADMHRPSLSQIEQGNMLPSPDVQKLIEKALRVRFDDPAVIQAFTILSGEPSEEVIAGEDEMALAYIGTGPGDEV